MPNFKRLVAQVHDIQADSPAQADEVARIRADAVNSGMRILGHGTAWAVKVLDSDSEDGGLTDILQDAYLLDEIDDNPERNPHTGYIALDETIVFEKLLAWRDAAVRAAFDAMLPPGLDERVAEITAFLKTVSVNYFDYGRLHDERAELKRVKRDHEAAVKRALGG
jgi:hypothetical protein